MNVSNPAPLPVELIITPGNPVDSDESVAVPTKDPLKYVVMAVPIAHIFNNPPAVVEYNAGS